MKRIAIPVDTTEFCHYGCGQTAKFMNGSKNLMCEQRSSSCPAIKEKNSNGLKTSYESNSRKPATELYQNLSDETKQRMNWNKGKRYADFSYGGRGNHKNALISERGHRCQECNLSEWLCKPITLELEHTDGDRKNNTKENLKLLCPNCHSQTPTWRRGDKKGWKMQRYTDEQIIETIKNSENLNQVLEKLDLRYGSAGTIIKIMNKYLVSFK